MNKVPLMLVFFLVGKGILFSQIQFKDFTQELLLDTTVNTFIPVAICDMNGDRLDDLVLLNNGKTLIIHYQGEANQAFSKLEFGKTGSTDEWSMCIADVDQNGYNDILVGGDYNGLKLYKANNTGTDYIVSTLEQSSLYAQGMNFVDIDNDGHLDIFACHDEGLSLTYRNDGFGGFSNVLDLINTASTIPSDNSGNYASCWTDYDQDGDLDLYLSKCSAFAPGNPLDGRRVNQLFQNDGLGNFVDVAEAANLRPLNQTWTSSFEDFDNDGDLDCFMINHERTSKMYTNNGDGTFTDRTLESGLKDVLESSDFGFQYNVNDFDNDGYLDIIYGETKFDNYLFHNNGDFTFSITKNPFTDAEFKRVNFVSGDLNNDGFIDLYAGTWQKTRNQDRLYLNEGNDNNYLKIFLEGSKSNLNAIGASLRIYGDWGVQIREIRSGESYGLMNSFVAHFGIGSAEFIDSLVVNWPSGLREKLCNISPNQTLYLQEENFPSLLQSAFTFEQENLELRCTDESSGSPDSWLWDFGDGQSSTDPNPTHRYAQEGIYTIQLTISNACETSSFVVNDLAVYSSPNSILAYPTFVQNWLFVRLAKWEKENIQVYDMAGRKVYEGQAEDESFAIEVGNWAAGAYVLVVGELDGGRSIRFLKD